MESSKFKTKTEQPGYRAQTPFCITLPFETDVHLASLYIWENWVSDILKGSQTRGPEPSPQTSCYQHLLSWAYCEKLSLPGILPQMRSPCLLGVWPLISWIRSTPMGFFFFFLFGQLPLLPSSWLFEREDVCQWTSTCFHVRFMRFWIKSPKKQINQRSYFPFN